MSSPVNELLDTSVRPTHANYMVHIHLAEYAASYITGIMKYVIDDSSKGSDGKCILYDIMLFITHGDRV